MKCELCHKNDAVTVFLRQTEAEEQEELYVCTSCATRERAFSQQHGIQVAAIDVPPQLAALLEKLPRIAKQQHHLPKELLRHVNDLFGIRSRKTDDDSETADPPKCKQCGMSLKDILSEHVVGCEHCYTTFNETFRELYHDFQGGTQTQTPPPWWYAVAQRINELRVAIKEAEKRQDFAKCKELSLEAKALIDTLKAADNDHEGQDNA